MPTKTSPPNDTSSLKRSKLIQNRTINKDNVQKLANALYAIYKNWKKKEKKHIQFILICDNEKGEEETRFRCASPVTLFSTDSPINSKRILSLEMRFYTDSDTEIQITLTHRPTNDAQNKIIIDGTEANWVNGTMKDLEDIIDSFNPQNIFFRRYRLLVNFIFSISIGFILGSIALQMAMRLVPDYSASEFSQTVLMLQKYPVVKYALFAFIGLIPSVIWTGKFVELWPKIEFQIGPEHKLTEKQRRKWVTTLFIVGIAPLLLQLFYDIARSFFN